MHQAAVLDGFALYAHAFQQDGLPPAEKDWTCSVFMPL